MRAFGVKRRPYYQKGAPISKYLPNALLSGLSICVLFIGSIIGLTVLQPAFQWNFGEGHVAVRLGILGTVGLGIVVGLIAAAGSLWQFYGADRTREKLEEWRKKQQGQ